MKREVEREKRLPSFSIDIGELEALWEKIHELFESDEIYSSIDIDLPSEKLEFDKIEELREYAGLPDKIYIFSITAYHKGKRVSVSSRSF